MTYRYNIEGLDASILMHPKVWEASGHVENFTDPMIDCKKCKARFRLDTLAENFNQKKKDKALEALSASSDNMKNLINDISGSLKDGEDIFENLLENDTVAFDLLQQMNCPLCGTKDSFTKPRNFNLMFKTFL